MSGEFEEAYNAKKTEFEDIPFIKKVMERHEKETKEFLIQYRVWKMTVLNPELNLLVGGIKKFLREGDEIRKLTAQDVANHLSGVSQEVEGLLLKTNGSTIILYINFTEPQKLFITTVIKDTKYKTRNKFVMDEMNTAFLQKHLTGAYNYLK